MARHALAVAAVLAFLAGYYAALDMMWRHKHEYPFEKLITHCYKLDQAQEAVQKSFEEDALKVVFTP